MAGLLERSESRRYELEKRRHKIIVVTTSFMCILVAVTIFAYIINAFLNKHYYSYKVLHTTARTDSNTVKYVSYNGIILKYSRDGASALDAAGNILWNGSYDMKNPAVDICEGYVAIADIGGKEVYVFNGKDSGTKVKTLLPIVQAEVANQGVIAVVLEDSDSNVITFYDPYNNTKPVKLDLPTNVQTDGYPVDISLSNDGHKLVTSYINVQSGSVESNVTFYNFDEIGDNSLNNLVKASNFGEKVIPDVEFLNNDTVCVYGEDHFAIYSKMQQPQEIFSNTFDSTIKSILSNENYIGFVLEQHGEEKKYELIVYDLLGKVILDTQIDYDYDQVFISGKEIIFYADLECIILRLTDKEKFHYTFDKSILYFLPVNDKENYVIIDDINIEEIKLSEDRKQ